MEKLDGYSMDIEKTEREKLKAVFPECFVEDKLDIDKLLNMCGEYITDDFERYEFKWKGKSECLQLAQKRSTGTLRPRPDESVNFADSKNLYIKGDNLEVLKILQASYYRRVKMIYIDPPYNTGNDFVYEDDFKDPIEHYKQVTSMATRSNPETMGRFHTAWLNMMYPRLRLAATLLRDDGVCFISIDDHEVRNLRMICDEVFGEENFIAQITNTNNPKGRSDDKFVATAHEYLLMYAKSKDFLGWYGFEPTEEITKRYNKVDEDGRKYREIDLRKTGENDLREDRPNLFYYFYYNEHTKDFYPSRDKKVPDGYIQIKPQRSDEKEGNWRWGLDTAIKNVSNLLPKFMPARKVWGMMEKDFLENRSLIKPTSAWTFKDINSERGSEEFINLGFDKRYFSNPKPIGTIKRCLKLSTSDNDIILDFFSGSATTAHAVMQLNAEDGGNRQYICVQLPELTDEKSEAYKAGYKNICDIGMERIRRAGAKVYAEWEEKQLQLSINENTKLPTLDVGFKVFELDTSNLKTWDTTTVTEENAQLIIERMNNMYERVKPDRTDLDMVYEIMLKMGFTLDMEIQRIQNGDKTAYVVDDYLLLIYLDESITPEIVEELCDLAPAKLLVAKGSFENATAMANAHYICQDKEIEFKLV